MKPKTMKIKLLFHLSLFTFLFAASPISSVHAQTQAEIAAMQNESSSSTTAKEKTAAEKKAEKELQKAEKQIADAKAKEIKDAEAAAKKASKNEKDAKPAKEKAAKAEKEAKPTKEKAVKEEKSDKPAKAKKEAKPAKAKAVKEDKPVKEKTAKEEKEAKPAKETTVAEKPAKETSSSSSKSNPTTLKSNYSNVQNKPLKTWSVDVGVNFTNPQTDIRYHDFFGTLDPKNEFKYGGQLRVTKMFDNAIGLQAQFAYNRLQGVYDTLVPYKEDRQSMAAAGITEGLYFRNNVIQGSLNIYWNISNTVFNINRYYRALNSRKPMKPRWFSLYAYTGIGVSIFDPHVMRLSDNVSVEDATVFPGVDFQTNRSTEVVVPAVLGAKVKISKTIDLGFEYGYNFIFSDKLDGFNYDHPGRLKTDAYTHGSLVLTMKLGGKKNAKEHIEWSNSMEPVFNELAKIGEIEKKVNKLTQDDDKDGVSDYFDKDTDTEEGATVGANGIRLDTDGDGVPDDMDMELFTGKGAEVDENGRAIDTDGDGVPDYLDLEDGTSKDEFVNFQGRSIDAYSKGKEGKLRNLALPSIFFDTDMATIKRDYEDELFQMALTIKRNNGLKFILEGHCDERGTDEYNIELGKRRAEAVKQYLIDNYKLDPAIFTIVSKGREEAMSPRYNINRRVDIIVAE